MDEYEQGGDFDCEIRIKDGQIVQLKMAGGTFKVANPFDIGRLDQMPGDRQRERRRPVRRVQRIHYTDIQRKRALYQVYEGVKI